MEAIANVSGAVRIYTDGASKGNPGPMGLGVVALDCDNKVLLEVGRFANEGTNQQAEILAAAHGLDLLARSDVEVLTDSQYVVCTMMDGWKRKANQSYWAILDAAVKRHIRVRFRHVRGHSGHVFNEMADSLASDAARRRETFKPSDAQPDAGQAAPSDPIDTESLEIIAAAAIKQSGLTYALPRPARHTHLIQIFTRITGKAPLPTEQGFVTSTGRFVSRTAAAKVAIKAGQLKQLDVAELQAESLW